MEVVLAKSAGFCFGVEKALNTVYKQIENGETVYTYGPIVHNEEVVLELQSMGVKVIETQEELKTLSEGTIIIRAHGVSERFYALADSLGLNLVDATCPFVKKIHKIVKKDSMEGRKVIIIGNDSHPEVEGIKGWCCGEYFVINGLEDLENTVFELGEKISIVSQTTFNYKNFQDIVEIISKKGYDIIVYNTICNATEERQTEAEQLAKESDAMIVIGGLHSSNTKKLYEISKSECKNTYYIQTLSDLDLDALKSFRSVGITAGASTPNNIIKEVHTACQK